MKTIIRILKEVALAVIGAVLIGFIVGVMEYTSGESQDLILGVLLISWSIFIAINITLIIEDYVNN